MHDDDDDFDDDDDYEDDDFDDDVDVDYDDDDDDDDDDFDDDDDDDDDDGDDDDDDDDDDDFDDDDDNDDDDFDDDDDYDDDDLMMMMMMMPMPMTLLTAWSLNKANSETLHLRGLQPHDRSTIWAPKGWPQSAGGKCWKQWCHVGTWWNWDKGPPKTPWKKNKPTTVGGSSFPKHPKLLLIVCYSNGTFPMKQPRRFSLGVYPVPINFIQFLDNFKTIPNPIFDIIMHYPFVLGAAASTYKERMTIKYRILGAKTHQMTKPN